MSKFLTDQFSIINLDKWNEENRKKGADKPRRSTKVKKNVRSSRPSPLRNKKKKLLARHTRVRTPPQKKVVLRKRKVAFQFYTNTQRLQPVSWRVRERCKTDRASIYEFKRTGK